MTFKELYELVKEYDAEDFVICLGDIELKENNIYFDYNCRTIDIETNE